LKGYVFCAIVAAFAQTILVPSASRSTLAIWLCAVLARQSFAQDLCLPQNDSPLSNPAPEPAATDAPPSALAPDEIVIDAPTFDIGANGVEAQFSDQVRARYGDATITAERATVDADTLEFGGRVTLEGPDVKVYGEDAKVDRQTETVTFKGAGFDLPKRPARGSADDITLQSDSTMSLLNVLFTTCPVNDPDWELHARETDLDINGGIGTAHGVKLDFKGVPILYAPYFSFPIDGRRKSGFLTPDISERDRTGFDLSVPYYLNLAPNYDLTLEPRYMSKRGVQLNSDFRYLQRNSEGQLGFEYLPNDDELNNATRSYVNYHHRSLFGDSWQVLTGIEEVSDDTYFEDLGSSLSVTSQTHLNRFVDLTYYTPYWSLLTRLQNYQTIDTVLTDEERPYERLPQMVFAGRWFGQRFGFDSSTELVNFDRNVGVTGWRFDSTQEVSMRFARAGMYLTPAVALRQTAYWLDSDTIAPDADDTPSRSLPIASVDTGMKFEREAGRTSTWLQTLEPRMLYVDVPYEDQSALPVFDTILPDFNLIQLFRKYQFVGPDRVADTEQFSFGVTTRLIDEQGTERLTATLGQTRYLNAQRVALPDESPNNGNDSDYVAEMSFGRDIWNLDVGYQWNNDAESTSRAETRFEYRPQEDRLFGFGYRYRRGFIEQGDLSVVWPATDKWRIIGRYSYSFLESEPLEEFVGWEYEACCWRFRMIGRRYVSSRTGEADSAISLQLELKGLSQGAPKPEELLDRGILGYRSFAQPNG
jgi:LPS-assembly protein